MFGFIGKSAENVGWRDGNAENHAFGNGRIGGGDALGVRAERRTHHELGRHELSGADLRNGRRTGRRFRPGCDWYAG